MIDSLRKYMWDQYEWCIANGVAVLGRNRQIQKTLKRHGDQSKEKLTFFKEFFKNRPHLMDRVFAQAPKHRHQELRDAGDRAKITIRGRNYATWRYKPAYLPTPMDQIFSQEELEEQQQVRDFVRSMPRIQKKTKKKRQFYRQPRNLVLPPPNDNSDGGWGQQIRRKKKRWNRRIVD